jgi:hypothetical protein
VLPDVGTGNCQFGCGPAATHFDNWCSVASHELVEAVTDPGVGVASYYGRKLRVYIYQFKVLT